MYISVPWKMIIAYLAQILVVQRDKYVASVVYFEQDPMYNKVGEDAHGLYWLN